MRQQTLIVSNVACFLIAVADIGDLCMTQIQKVFDSQRGSLSASANDFVHAVIRGVTVNGENSRIESRHSLCKISRTFAENNQTISRWKRTGRRIDGKIRNIQNLSDDAVLFMEFGFYIAENFPEKGIRFQRIKSSQ